MSSTPSAGAELFFVEVRARDRASLVAWYTEMLGLSVVLDDPTGDFTLLAAGPARLAIKGGRDTAASGSIALAFRVDDVGAVRDRLVARGVAVTGPEESPEGYRAIGLADPTGHPLRVFQWST